MLSYLSTPFWVEAQGNRTKYSAILYRKGRFSKVLIAQLRKRYKYINQ